MIKKIQYIEEFLMECNKLKTTDKFKPKWEEARNRFKQQTKEVKSMETLALELGKTILESMAAEYARTNQIVSRIITVTPELAREFVSHNLNNRRLSQKIVEIYASRMKKGKWEINNDDLGFDTEGRMLNGQHRCWACI